MGWDNTSHSLTRSCLLPTVPLLNHISELGNDGTTDVCGLNTHINTYELRVVAKQILCILNMAMMKVGLESVKRFDWLYYKYMNLIIVGCLALIIINIEVLVDTEVH